MAMRRISWLDSVGVPSLIHLTVDGKDTKCGGHEEYVANRQLVKVPRKKRGVSNYCRVCFKTGGKTMPWDERCKELG